MRIAITGGRDFTDEALVNRMLSAVRKKHGNFTMIVGRCKTGADALAEQWAIENGIIVEPYPANWKKFGRAAGPIRNQQMIDEGKPDALVAFPGDRGTADMIDRCTQAKIPRWVWEK